MASRRVVDSNREPPRRSPARTPEAREAQLIAKAFDRAEQQIDDGTVSAQVLTHYLKLGSSRERIEQARLQAEVSLLHIKEETYASQARVEALYSEALDAMRAYSGQTVERQDYDD